MVQRYVLVMETDRTVRYSIFKRFFLGSSSRPDSAISAYNCLNVKIIAVDRAKLPDKLAVVVKYFVNIIMFAFYSRYAI
jgi:hypothetical protein